MAKAKVKQESESYDEIVLAIRRLANSICPCLVGSNDDTGGYVESLTESVMGHTNAMCKVADAISDLAAAIRETRQ